MSAVRKEYKRVTTKSVVEMKANGEKISMLTAYDYTFAKLLDSAGIDVLLVGDSASNVMAGHETTLPITLDQMIYHASSVVLKSKKKLLSERYIKPSLNHKQKNKLSKIRSRLDY